MSVQHRAVTRTYRDRIHDIATLATYGMGILAVGLLARAAINVVHIVSVLS